MKVKILGAALLALAATSALAVTNASGTANGHFYHHAVGTSVAITAHDGSTTAHKLEFTRLSPGTDTTTGNGITCKTSQYTGQVTERTTSTIRLFPKYTECLTTPGGVYDEVKVHPYHCSYIFSSQGTRKHGTVSIDCPAGQSIEITHPNCTTKVPAQTASATTLTEGISYANQADGTITATVTVNTITGHFEAGICVFLGTQQKFEMKGSVTVEGFNYVSGEGTTHTLKHEGKVAITST